MAARAAHGLSHSIVVQDVGNALAVCVGAAREEDEREKSEKKRPRKKVKSGKHTRQQIVPSGSTEAAPG